MRVGRNVMFEIGVAVSSCYMTMMRGVGRVLLNCDLETKEASECRQGMHGDTPNYVFILTARSGMGVLIGSYRHILIVLRQR